MSIRVALHHVTHYRYDRLVALSPQVVRLRPAPHCRTPILSYSMRVEPAEHFINWQQDAFANYQARLVFPEKTREFKVTVDLIAEMAVYNPFDFFLEPSAEQFPFDYSPGLALELAPYRVKRPMTPRFAEFVASIDRTASGTADFLVGLNQRLQREIRYLIRMEPGVQTPEETLVSAAGSCRDSGWLLVETLRQLGLAARFVSGYLLQLAPDIKSIDGPSGTEVDFTDLHAWCEVYLPGAGWIGLDPTSGLLAGEGHIPVACTPEPGSAAPISGAVDESEVEFEHTMSIERVLETPRVTKPFSEAVWRDVLKMGAQVDQQLADMDVRLTMGGEPTFVSVRDRDAAEWNTDALGPTKRGYAVALMDKLRSRYGANGFLHIGQGKWYPGEQLPRWAMSLYWRADGEPCWHDPNLFADEREPGLYTAHDAQRFLAHLAAKLSLDKDCIQPGYEDVWYYLWRERRLPVNVDPFDTKLDDELERVRLRRVFDAGLSGATGFVLPIGRERDTPNEAPRWVSGRWFFRDERMYLIPGDSPMGYRLPLDSLPWVSKTDYPYQHAHDPFAPPVPLRAAAQLRQQYHNGESAGRDSRAATAAEARQAGALSLSAADLLSGMAGSGVLAYAGQQGAPHEDQQGNQQAPARGQSSKETLRTAICVEARDPKRAAGPKAESEAFGSGRTLLHVFMPPLTELDDYLDLLAAIEATAAELKMQVVLEGYPPPRDARLKVLQVTPDPGVIEVNIHPAANWDQLVDHTEYLYQSAAESYLSSEKFMTDGRHTGTGGGNHFVLGGATPADSPFLRRPDLLASLIAYWHNHPSLSYLFSGLFIGPTSQAPRIDEARNDQVYELEVALRELQRQIDLLGGRDSASLPPWMIDRSLRNILIDVTGNTHRAEFCIDKLYSPDGPTGRLGLLELRGFEMPPHARMSLVQQLLLRALVARFWHTPYTQRLTRWGTELHDRFLLGTFVKMDFDDVLGELNRAGFAFDSSWFAPHFEFRFPLVGETTVNGVSLTIRNALEPWHVMGEEGSPGGTVRYVDSSVERLEVRALGLNDNRHVLTVNGVPMPLQPTGRVSEYVAGVRFRAWSQPSALHPTIGVDAPLTFDLVDTWSGRSVGGCQYHVAHPGGRNYQTFPINAYEAESRRRARFFASGHTPGPLTVDTPQRSLEFPFTLDLRYW